MLRWLYIQLMWAHPAQFRYRFCDEMLEIFDDCRGVRARLRLLGDALASVLRQWILRPEFRQPWQTFSAAGTSAGHRDIPFQQIEAYRPNRAALIQGGLLTMLVMMGLVWAINHGGSKLRRLGIGMARSGFGLIVVDRKDMEGEFTTMVTRGKPDEDPRRPFAKSYFAQMPVLMVLDANRDLVLSREELTQAPAELRWLDKDRDGMLSAEECGSQDADGPAKGFMRGHPVLAALDVNHDGAISAAEMDRAEMSLSTLDTVIDEKLAQYSMGAMGTLAEVRLTAYELMPSKALARAAGLLTRFDLNDDGVLSGSELTMGVDGADRNGDGVVTRGELICAWAARR